MTLTYSIIAPIYNEKENLPELYARVREVMDSTGEPWELLLVDDGSTDSSSEIIRRLAREDVDVVRANLVSHGFHLQMPPRADFDPLTDDWGTDA